MVVLFRCAAQSMSRLPSGITSSWGMVQPAAPVIMVEAARHGLAVAQCLLEPDGAVAGLVDRATAELVVSPMGWVYAP
jgi:hypothetical protein